MRLSLRLGLRRILNASYHPFKVIPKPSIWPNRERLKRFTAWQYGQEALTVRSGYRKLNKVFIYMNMQREDAPRLERYYAEERVKVALEELHTDFYVFQRMLRRAHILLDLRALAQLAIYEPDSFKCLVDLAQKMALIDGEMVVQSPEALAHVQCDGSLFGDPFPEAELYPEGALENHLEVPRELTLDEF
ncbi:hypothetical protein niasHS_003461 [Heterodera schachtii]|uniref:Ribosomal protein L20 n=1 Tax=Heterodera schachtii TaxID=97005 RepID=A0ABD2KGK0_HETSC